MSKGGQLMAEEVFIPKYGQTVEEVTLIKWMAADGAQVKKGQEILEIETDKTNFTVEAEANGFLHRGPYAEGQVIPVLTVVAIIGKEGEKFSAGAPAGTMIASPVEEAAVAEAATAAPTAAAPEASKVFASPRARKLAEEKGADLAAIPPTGGGGVRVAERDVLAYLASAPKASPIAQRLAEEAGIDLRTVTGTGPAGRITKEDVERAITSQAPVAIPTPPAVPTGAVAPVRIQLPVAEVVERVPLKGVRAIIADRMGTSVHTTAHVTLMMDVDATEFVSVRDRLKAKVSEEWGYAPGYNDLLAVMVAKALRNFPYMNARLAPDAIEILAHVNLGMAVDTERGLLVPVIRDADRKSLREFGAEFRELVDRARRGKSLPDDLSGGSFTITNLGMFDVEAFTPIINLPEAAILGVGRIIPKWIYRPESPNAPVLRQMMALSLVFDHRVVDGAPAARFLQYIKGLVEEPYLLLAS
jgi:pyruvate dehydrogenase E2 component (dihydrolipoyllysine-residue acetyltransferase)